MGWEHSLGDAAVKYHLPAECLRRLGKATDVSLAEEFEVPVEQVRRVRKELGLPPFRLESVVGPLLGKMPDAVLARRVGATRGHIRELRIARGIPPCPRKQFNRDEKLRAYIDAVKETR